MEVSQWFQCLIFSEPASENHDRIKGLYSICPFRNRIHICHFPDHQNKKRAVNQTHIGFNNLSAPWKHYPLPSADAVRFSTFVSVMYHAERSWHILNPLFLPRMTTQRTHRSSPFRVIRHSRNSGSFSDPSAFLQYNHGRKEDTAFLSVSQHRIHK